MSAFTKNNSTSTTITNFHATKLSSHNNLPTVSMGIPSLNSVIGGSAGLPLNSALLLKQDNLTSYAKTISLYFIAQGLASGHHVLFLGGDHLSGVNAQVDQLMDVVGVDERGSALVQDNEDEDNEVEPIPSTNKISRELGNV